MKGFNFEKNLAHQTQAVRNTVGVLEGVPFAQPQGPDRNCINPLFNTEEGFEYIDNLIALQQREGIDPKHRNKRSHVIDIMMETGTGKTYTYTKTMFELNRYYGVFKFVVVVPTLSIKAGTINFLKSESSRQHFKEQYGKSLNLHIVESKKAKKNKRDFMPPAVNSFVNSGSFEKDSIQVMIINAGMLNSPSMQQSYDRGLFDRYTIPFQALAATSPFVIIDEPHKFAETKVGWKNIQQMAPQFILRYGATFPDKTIKVKNHLTNKLENETVKSYHNLIYQLTAVDSFNQNLVKGVIGHITEFEQGKNVVLKFTNSDGKEASFELENNGRKKSLKIGPKESLEKLHPEMTSLQIEKLNKGSLWLSNGLELKKGDKVNPYSYAQTLQELMIRKAIQKHFELEKELLNRDIKIKPLTLFFIDNIEEYRNKNGQLRQLVESLIEAEAKQLLEKEATGYYHDFLTQTLSDISKTHAGYFSKDNSDKDEAIEKEVNEILHDKQAILDLKNPRRFIFSKWTLREGWDNPNVFQICKLRSSGSEISKLQEVGRGLRLPVNEYGNRVKDEQFYLNYFVDFTESDFVDSLVEEINNKSGALSIEAQPEQLTDKMIANICDTYHTTEDDLLELLDEKSLITRSNKFKEGGYEYVKRHYPLIFEGVNSNKVRRASDTKKKVGVRQEKYQALKELWEKLNEKVVLEYRFESEDAFQALLTEFFQRHKGKFLLEGVKSRESKVAIEDSQARTMEEESVLEEEFTPISTMKYGDFLKETARVLDINLKTVHQALVASEVNINAYLNGSTIRIIKQYFNDFLMYHAIDKFSIEYKKVRNGIHPTKLTHANGELREDVQASDVGVLYSEERVADSYLFDELFYDSELEKDNIEKELKEVVVFTKIPKNSIKIPVAGGRSYSPDFAYVLEYENGKKKLNFIVETKNMAGEDKLRPEERQKIRHAEQFFGSDVKIEFKTQFSNKKIDALIREIVGEVGSSFSA